MDPQQCIKDAEYLMEQGETEEAEYLVQCFREWQRKGGFSSPDLDQRAQHIEWLLSF